MPLRDTLHKLAAPFTHRMIGACLSEKDIAALSRAAAQATPAQSAWHTLSYPGEWTLPIYLAPLTLPLAEPVQAAVHDLRLAMQKEGFSLSSSKVADLHEQRQAHLWLAHLGRDEYLPIGQAVFILEERTEATEAAHPSTAGADAMRLDQASRQVALRRWWLHHVWLRPAYRCQRIFRHSVPYFEGWHPGFVVRDPWPALARALAGHPGHIVDGTVQWF